MIAEARQLRVAVFAGSQFAVNLIAELMQRKQLALVVFPGKNSQKDDFSVLAQALEAAQVPFVVLRSGQQEVIAEHLKRLHITVGIVATFPQKIPASLIQAFRLGLYNLHAALLPAYPGPAPIYWQIRDGQSESGIVLHRVTEQMDSGNIVAKRLVAIHPLDTSASLHNQMAHLGTQLVSAALEELMRLKTPLLGEVQTRHFSALSEAAVYARRPEQQDNVIRLSEQNAEDIAAICRAGNGTQVPVIIELKQVWVQLLQATAVDYPTFNTPPGTVLFVGDPEGFIVAACGSALRLEVLSCSDGIFGGLAFAERFGIDAGAQLSVPLFFKQRA